MTDKGRRDAFDFSGDSKKSNINADKIKEEVEKLKDKRGNLTPAVIAELYNKYPDNEAIVDEILRLSTKRYNKIRKQAKEIAEKVYRKYSEGTRPLHEIFEKMMRYKARITGPMLNMMNSEKNSLH